MPADEGACGCEAGNCPDVALTVVLGICGCPTVGTLEPEPCCTGAVPLNPSGPVGFYVEVECICCAAKAYNEHVEAAAELAICPLSKLIVDE